MLRAGVWVCVSVACTVCTYRWLLALPRGASCCDIKMEVIGSGKAVGGWVGGRRFQVSESWDCASLILLIIKMDVPVIVGFPLSARLSAERASRAGSSYREVRSNLPFCIWIFRAAWL